MRPQLMRSARALILAAEYLLVLVALWVSFANAASLRSLRAGQPSSETANALAKAGRMLLYPNALGFAACALWFARRRTFVPLARYLVPAVFAGLLTFPLLFIALYADWWALYLLWPMPQVVRLLLLSWPAVLPGLITAQLLRWPKVKSVEARDETRLSNKAIETAMR